MPLSTPARAATVCPDLPLLFENLGRRQVVVDFSGGHLSADGGALRLRLLKVAARVTVNVRRIHVQLSSAHAGQELFRCCAWRLGVAAGLT